MMEEIIDQEQVNIPLDGGKMVKRAKPKFRRLQLQKGPGPVKGTYMPDIQRFSATDHLKIDMTAPYLQ